MTWEMQQIIATTNLVVCLGIMWASLCRLNSETCLRYPSTRVRYVALLSAGFVSGFQSVLFKEQPGIADVLFSSAILTGLALNAFRWGKHPGYTRRKEDQ